MSNEERLSLNNYLEDLYQAMQIGDIVFEAKDSFELYNLINEMLEENKKYKEVIDNLKDKLMEYFEVGRDSYFYVLTRDKSAFDYGTMYFDDFIEFSEEQVDDIVNFLKEVEHE